MKHIWQVFTLLIDKNNFCCSLNEKKILPEDSVSDWQNSLSAGLLEYKKDGTGFSPLLNCKILRISLCCVSFKMQNDTKNTVHRLLRPRKQQRSGCLREPNVQHQHEGCGGEGRSIRPQSEYCLHHGLKNNPQQSELNNSDI